MQASGYYDKIKRPELIKEAFRRFGSSTILISIEAIKMADGSCEANTDNGRDRTGIYAMEWAIKAADLGAGEILITSIDHEDAGKGYDLELTKKLAESVDIPVIACVDAGDANHVEQVIRLGKADAVSMASILHYDLINRDHADHDFSGEGNTEYLRRKRAFSNIKPATLPGIKNYPIS
jgi:cyclase